MSIVRLFCIATLLSVSNVSVAEKYSTTYSESPPKELAAWDAGGKTLTVRVRCYEDELFILWPVATCDISLTKPENNTNMYGIHIRSSDSKGALYFQGEVDTFSDNYNGEYSSVSFKYNDSLDKTSEEAQFKYGSGVYTLNGFNDYIKEEVESKRSILREDILFKQILVGGALIIAFILGWLFVKFLFKCIKGFMEFIPVLLGKAKGSLNKAGDAVTKLDVARRNRKLRDTMINETVLLSVRDAYNQMDSEETSALRKEIAKAIANNDAQLANKLGEVLTNIESKRNES